MLTGDIRSQIDRIQDAFWTGGISNPLEVMEQITYLLFLRRLDDLHTLAENQPAGASRSRPRTPSSPLARIRKSAATKISAGRASATSPRQRCTSWYPNTSFPFLRTFGSDDSTYATHMKDARFTIPTPALLVQGGGPAGRSAHGLPGHQGRPLRIHAGKIATAGQNGQFRTPRHIIRLMVDMMAPQPTDLLCDPACGTSGFLVAARRIPREYHPETSCTMPSTGEHFNHECSTASISTTRCSASAA